MKGAAILRVLIVDDEPIIADSLVAILEAHGCHARATYTAEGAATAADEFQPHAVISDVMMPGMSGLDLADWLEENHPACKVLLISGNLDTAEMLLESHRSGCRIILPKPIRPEEVLRFVDTCSPVSDCTPRAGHSRARR